MPRRNKHKPRPYFQGASLFDSGFKAECYGCAFAGTGFKCLTSDGKCLKIKPENKGNLPSEDDHAADSV